MSMSDEVATKAWCSIHQCHPQECFFQHNVAEELAEEPLASIAMITLPCHHLCRRPEKEYAVVECQCGKKWKMLLEFGGKAWVAKEVTND